MKKFMGQKFDVGKTSKEEKNMTRTVFGKLSRKSYSLFDTRRIAPHVKEKHEKA